MIAFSIVPDSLSQAWRRRGIDRLKSGMFQIQQVFSQNAWLY